MGDCVRRIFLVHPSHDGCPNRAAWFCFVTHFVLVFDVWVFGVHSSKALPSKFEPALRRGQVRPVPPLCPSRSSGQFRCSLRLRLPIAAPPAFRFRLHLNNPIGLSCRRVFQVVRISYLFAVWVFGCFSVLTFTRSPPDSTSVPAPRATRAIHPPPAVLHPQPPASISSSSRPEFPHRHPAWRSPRV